VRRPTAVTTTSWLACAVVVASLCLARPGIAESLDGCMALPRSPRSYRSLRSYSYSAAMLRQTTSCRQILRKRTKNGIGNSAHKPGGFAVP
jgi:hypothetical protein